MELNVKKCKYMCFKRSFPTNGTIELGNSFDDLGIIFVCKLGFKNHITSTVSKATCTLGFMKRWVKGFSDPYGTEPLFTTLFRPNLEYGSAIWGFQYAVHSDKIESVQKQFLLFFFFFVT